MEPTRLLIIDDHDKVREALRARLDATPNIEVVGCTGCWRAGLGRALMLEPDVVLLETKRADGEGMEALARLADECATSHVVVLTSYSEASERAEVRSQGAAGYLLKTIDTGQLVHEIRSLTDRLARDDASLTK
jgi:NarL family two-component system response regulator LiaR